MNMTSLNGNNDIDKKSVISLLAITRFINIRRSGCLDRDFADSVCGTIETMVGL